jgi:hypothetical protein
MPLRLGAVSPPPNDTNLIKYVTAADSDSEVLIIKGQSEQYHVTDLVGSLSQLTVFSAHLRTFHLCFPFRAAHRPVNGYGHQKGGRLSGTSDSRRDGTAKERP